MAVEPMIILVAVGFYLATGSFFVSDIVSSVQPMILLLPGIFLGFFYALTMKLRKSPFDIATSHHAHQEIVKGVTTEFSGSTLGMVEIAHWYKSRPSARHRRALLRRNPMVAVRGGRAPLRRGDLHRQYERALKSGARPDGISVVTFVFSVANLAVFYIG